ncbi:unnamed protein product [Ectocarpus sp. CCAP 1310/34]|nr:unnamed protein product [Ectocarpus sp. CCAP 1310/34]
MAVAEVKVGKDTPVLDAAGKAGFFLWRSTYVVKQASVSKRAFSSTSLASWHVCWSFHWCCVHLFQEFSDLPGELTGCL